MIPENIFPESADLERAKASETHLQKGQNTVQCCADELLYRQMGKIVRKRLYSYRTN